MSRYTLVFVRWHDAVGWDYQEDPANLKGPLVIDTVGFLVREDAKGIYLAQEILENGDVRGGGFIPHAMVAARFDLRPRNLPSPLS